MEMNPNDNDAGLDRGPFLDAAASIPEQRIQGDPALENTSERPSGEVKQGKEDEASPKRKRTQLDEKRLEARRKSNRLSAQRARVRTKTLIQELEEDRANLQAANGILVMKLEQVLAENDLLRRMVRAERRDIVDQNQLYAREISLRLAAQTQSINRLDRMADAASYESLLAHRGLPVSQDATSRAAARSFQPMPQDSATYGLRTPLIQRALEELKDAGEDE